MASYRLNEKAEEDLSRIWFYGLEKYGQAQADAYFAKFFTALNNWLNNPILLPRLIISVQAIAVLYAG